MRTGAAQGCDFASACVQNSSSDKKVSSEGKEPQATDPNYQEYIPSNPSRHFGKTNPNTAQRGD
jgi:hypothetical protein